ncbi:hypothetical protein BJ508DRAFT_325730 [Ascobolus immersus RN42]|uniref:F-box domain-containing protein n=1 Tax=Ascobolus immersus RN42 TaxID=1160509 RepID=A0A3N4I801_ASCIM|nr:hypothetical protein BJ508DRAFT_325730 [Ascobolus immersus RN42]
MDLEEELTICELVHNISLSTSHPKATTLLSLPNELLHIIATFIPTLSSYHSFAVVNHRLAAVASTPSTRNIFITQLSEASVFRLLVDNLLNVSKFTFYIIQLKPRLINSADPDSDVIIFQVRHTFGGHHIPDRVVGEFPLRREWFRRFCELWRAWHGPAGDVVSFDEPIYTSLPPFTPEQARERAALIWDLIKRCEVCPKRDEIWKIPFQEDKNWTIVGIGYEYLVPEPTVSPDPGEDDDDSDLDDAYDDEGSLLTFWREPNEWRGERGVEWLYRSALIDKHGDEWNAGGVKVMRLRT